MSLSSLVSSLRAAQSTSRVIGHERQGERRKWHLVDREMLILLQTHLEHLENDIGEESLSSTLWTECEAACDLLRGLIPIATGLEYVTAAPNAILLM